MNSKKDLRRLAQLLVKIGDSLVERHAIAKGTLKAPLRSKRNSRKSIAEELRELSKKLASLGDKLHYSKDKKPSKGVKLLQPTKRTVKNAVASFVRKFLIKPAKV